MSGRVCAGVDGCSGGWIMVVRKPAASEVAVVADFAAALDRLPDDAVIAVDMPIGLAQRVGPGGRGPEAAIRPLLGARQSSVFSIPARAAVYAEDYGEACRRARETSMPPRKVSRLAFHLFPKIREIDRVLRTRPDLAERIVEAHPELAFWRLNGERPMTLPKKVKSRVNPVGMAERRALLARSGYDPAFLDQRPPKGAAFDDFLDAAGLALVAQAFVCGEARPYPDPFERDAFGLPMAIWA